MKLIDLTGQTFGKLTVINRADNHVRTSGRVDICWNCICECGNKCVIRGERLRNGTTKSCGCSKSEFLREYRKKYNNFNLNGTYGSDNEANDMHDKVCLEIVDMLVENLI